MSQLDKKEPLNSLHNKYILLKVPLKATIHILSVPSYVLSNPCQ